MTDFENGCENGCAFASERCQGPCDRANGLAYRLIGARSQTDTARPGPGKSADRVCAFCCLTKSRVLAKSRRLHPHGGDLLIRRASIDLRLGCLVVVFCGFRQANVTARWTASAPLASNPPRGANIYLVPRPWSCSASHPAPDLAHRTVADRPGRPVRPCLCLCPSLCPYLCPWPGRDPYLCPCPCPCRGLGPDPCPRLVPPVETRHENAQRAA